MKDTTLSLSGFQLKYIALISMILDHFAIIWKSLLPNSCYFVLRCLGRFAFPLFAFLLVEGFLYTKNREKHLLLLLLFAILTELSFDICLYHGLTEQIPGPMVMNHQNTLFTLSIGFLMLMYLTRFRSEAAVCIIIASACVLSELLCTDYGALGILTILLFYYRRINADLQAQNAWLWIPIVPLFLSSLSFPPQLACILAPIPLSLYHGEKGKGMKYFFYIMYPLHLLLLYGVKAYFW